MRVILSGLIILFFSACKKENNRLYDFPLTDMSGNPYYLTKFHDPDEVNVIYFLAPECPMSEAATSIINHYDSLDKQRSYPTLSFYVVIPGNFYSNDEIAAFIERNKIVPVVLKDDACKLAETLNATVTPEVFVIGNDGKILYKGAIDNGASALGQKREVVTEFYLRDVLKAVVGRTAISTPFTEATGCSIECETAN